MKKQLAIAGVTAAVLAIAAGGIAVNAATLSAVPTSKLGNVPAVLSHDRGDDDSAAPTPSPSTTAEPGDDNLPRHSGQDDPAGHDAGDDNGADDPAGHDVGDDHGGATAPAPSGNSGSGSSNSGSGSSNSGPGNSGSGNSGSGSGNSGSGSSGHGGGSDD